MKRLLCLLVGFGSMGCSSIVSEQDLDASFTVTPKADGTYFWWNEITLGEDVNSFGVARLQFVRLDAQAPAKDLTFLSMVQGEAVTSQARTLIAKRDGMPKGEPNVVLDVLHEGDVRPFFEDGRTVRIEWTGTTNPNFMAWPTGGITVNVKARIVLDD
jgi:hypothetical protein